MNDRLNPPTPEQLRERRTALVAELRSGSRLQAGGRLRWVNDVATTYCCLGVACDLSDLGEWRDRIGGFSTYNIDTIDPDNSTHLPRPVQRYYGFSVNNGEFDPHSLPIDILERLEYEHGITFGTHALSCLANLNDSGVPFGLIADIIEAEPRGLFLRS